MIVVVLILSMSYPSRQKKHGWKRSKIPCQVLLALRTLNIIIQWNILSTCRGWWKRIRQYPNKTFSIEVIVQNVDCSVVYYIAPTKTHPLMHTRLMETGDNWFTFVFLILTWPYHLSTQQDHNSGTNSHQFPTLHTYINSKINFNRNTT